MYKVTYQVAMPNGKFRTSMQWTVAKDEADARKQISDALEKLNYKWFKITSVKKLH